MRHRRLTLAFSAVILAATALLWTVIPKGLFPPDDTGSLNATAEAAQGTSFVEMLRLQRSSRRLALAKDTNVQSYTANIGSFGGSTNQAQFNITLKPAGQRPSADDMVHELTRRMSGIPGARRSSSRIRRRSASAGAARRRSYQYTLRGPDITNAVLRGQQADGAAAGRCRLLTERDVGSAQPQPDPARAHRPSEGARRSACRRSAIENALANAYNQQQVSTIFTATNEYWVVMETVPSAQLDASALEHFFVPGTNGSAGAAHRRRVLRARRPAR